MAFLSASGSMAESGQVGKGPRLGRGTLLSWRRCQVRRLDGMILKNDGTRMIQLNDQGLNILMDLSLVNSFPMAASAKG